MSYRSKSTGQVISEVDYHMMWGILQHYRYERQTTDKQQKAIVTILNDFVEVIE